ncbi:hypothetical protein M758_1G157800 [Ceratodon purpureus]|uniref:Uncharacterized protein n=1 Tax=Ceratodon purpureus TaxID=3225 RepID=A0A8T0J5S9_CERPU|nr:hypothetical protein KC19_1G162000 [Ceratodon purpureus]KAG0630155.1 hypothetical protein M758_1G157800 [Ceratodon purpureus]
MVQFEFLIFCNLCLLHFSNALACSFLIHPGSSHVDSSSIENILFIYAKPLSYLVVC